MQQEVKRSARDALVLKTVRESAKTTPEQVRPFVDVVGKAHLDAIEKTERNVSRYKNAVEGALRDAAYYKEQAKSYQANVKAHEKELKKLKSKKLPEFDLDTVYARIAKHKALQYFTIDSKGSLVLYFKPIWVDGQISGDSKERSRMLVGAFKVSVANDTSLSVRIDNLTFPEMTNPHWSVSDSHRPCWGEWEGVVKSQWVEGKLYDLITTLTAYLSSTQDGAAYTRTHRFRTNRLESISIQSPSKALSPEYAYADGDEHSSTTALDYLPAQYFATGSGSMLAFLVPMGGCHHRSSFPHYGNQWYTTSYKKLPSECVPELLALIESLKDATDEEKRETAREWVKNIIGGGNDIIKAKKELLEELDAATELPYQLVAQPLTIDVTKITS